MNDQLTIRSRDSLPLDILFQAVEEAQRFYQAGLESTDGEAARRHLAEERRLPRDLVEAEGFGYVGAGWASLVNHLANKGTSLEAAAEAGLVLRSIGRVRKAFVASEGREPASSDELTRFFYERCADQREFYYDYPRCYMADGSRESGFWLTIPIRVRDPEGKIRVAGFQYRTMRPVDQVVKQGRYMSPLRSSRLLNWSELILGLAEQEEAMRRSGEVVICEGKFDQAAVLAAVSTLPPEKRPGVVALAGVSIRGATGETPEERAGIFRQLAAGKATFFLDTDETGIDAVLAAGPLLEALGTRVTVAQIEEGGIKDPGELYAQRGAAGVLRTLEAARRRGLATHALELLEREMEGDDRSGQTWRRLAAIDRLLPILKALPDGVRGRALARCAERTGIGYDVFTAGLAVPDVQPGRTRPQGRSGARR